MKILAQNLLEKTLIALMAVMTLDVLWGVFTRYVMGSQASWSEELARFLLIWIGILGAAYASGKQMHLSIDLFPDSLTAERKNRLWIVIDLLIILFVVAVMILGGIRLVYITSYLEQNSAALNWPLGSVYSVLPLSGFYILFQKIGDIQTRLLTIREQK